MNSSFIVIVLMIVYFICVCVLFQKTGLLCSFLNLSYYWAAEALLVEQYAEVGRDELLVSVGTKLKEGCEAQNGPGILSYLHPYLSNTEWSDIYEQVVNSEEDNCKDVMVSDWNNNPNILKFFFHASFCVCSLFSLS